MKKILLINSYSDNNKGDLGIILGTINSIKHASKEIIVSAVSSFSKNDPFFETQHSELKKYISNITPTIIGRVHNKFLLSKILNVINGFFLDFFLKICNKNIFKLFLKINNNDLLNEILSSDIIISKGGSFLCNKDNIIDKIRLRRELIIFKICLKLEKPLYILGQSIGPVYGNSSLKNLKTVLSKINSIIIRENECLIQYPNIFKHLDNVILGNDLAFNLFFDHKKKKNSIDKKDLNIGFTLKNYDTRQKNITYINLLKHIILYLNDNYKCHFHFIPHVTIDDDDIQYQNLKNVLPIEILKLCNFDENIYSIDELLNVYHQKDILIGTRLHSTIFSLIVNTPVVNLGYHGTKAKGVFKKCDLNEYQFDITDCADEVCNSINKLIINDFDFSERLEQIRTENNKIVNIILSNE